MTPEPAARPHRSAAAQRGAGAPAPVTYTVAVVCEITGLGRTKVFDLLREGRLRKVKVGRRTLVGAESVHELLA